MSCDNGIWFGPKPSQSGSVPPDWEIPTEDWPKLKELLHMTDDKALRDELAEGKNNPRRWWESEPGLLEIAYKRSCSPEYENDIDVAKREIQDLRAMIEMGDRLHEDEIPAERARAQRLVEAAKYVWDAFQGSCDSDHGNSLMGLHEAIAAYERGKPLP